MAAVTHKLIYDPFPLYLIDMTTFHVFFSYISSNFWFCISKLHIENCIMFPTNNH
jgi:hypothetical protein